jgi:hypothetical protein
VLRHGGKLTEVALEREKGNQDVVSSFGVVACIMQEQESCGAISSTIVAKSWSGKSRLSLVQHHDEALRNSTETIWIQVSQVQPPIPREHSGEAAVNTFQEKPIFISPRSSVIVILVSGGHERYSVLLILRHWKHRLRHSVVDVQCQ